jgi:hypothetical protein
VYSATHVPCSPSALVLNYKGLPILPLPIRSSFPPDIWGPGCEYMISRLVGISGEVSDFPQS